MHFLQPDSDEDTAAEAKTAAAAVPQTTSTASNSKETQQQNKSSSSKSVRVAIEIDDDDDTEEENKHTSSNNNDNNNNNKEESFLTEPKLNIESKQEQEQEKQQSKAASAASPSPPSSSLTSKSDQFFFSFSPRSFPWIAPKQNNTNKQDLSVEERIEAVKKQQQQNNDDNENGGGGGDKELAELINKWGLAESMSALQFHFEMIVDTHTYANSKSATVQGQVHSGMMQDFVVALFNSESFQAFFKPGDGHGGRSSYFNLAGSPVVSVKLEQLRCNSTTLELFDKLQDEDNYPQIVRSTGHLCGMADEFLPCGVTVSDQLRGLFMLGEESECYDVYTDAERNDFLYHVMWRLVSGGAVNQYEDQFDPYKDATRDVYKSLVSVGRSKGDSNELEVQSLVYAVKDVRVAGSSGSTTSIMKSHFYPKDDRTGNHNFCYLIVDPMRKNCIVWHNSFFSPF